jgi:preprotein translocase subunit YajC
VMQASAVFVLAQAGGGSGGAGGLLGMFVPMAIIFAIFYFMLIRPQQRKEKERQKMINETKTGDRILFSGGIVGTVTNVRENSLVVKIADGVKIDVLRGAVSKVLTKDEKVNKDDGKAE